MSDLLQVTLFVLIVLAIFVVPFFVWRLDSKRKSEPNDNDWEKRARRMSTVAGEARKPPTADGYQERRALVTRQRRLPARDRGATA
jgi:hypothetical protein